MQLHTEWVTCTHEGEKLEGYLARPEQITTGMPGILLIHDLFGVDHHVKDVAERLAKCNYLVIAPDLYSKKRPPQLSNERLNRLREFFNTISPNTWWDHDERERLIDEFTEGDSAELRDTIRAVPTSVYGPQPPQRFVDLVNDLKAWLNLLKDLGAPSLGCMGFCMGGNLTFRLSSEYPGLQAGVVFYGGAPSADALEKVSCPVLGLYGEEDHSITDKVPQVAADMSRLGKSYDYRIYKNAGHAFFEDQRRSFEPNASRDAWTNTLWFFNKHLTVG